MQNHPLCVQLKELTDRDQYEAATVEALDKQTLADRVGVDAKQLGEAFVAGLKRAVWQYLRNKELEAEGELMAVALRPLYPTVEVDRITTKRGKPCVRIWLDARPDVEDYP